jgi:peptide/nickel transport system substrate-binding protein/oligopeptide transport system substrate-binding protein
LHVKLSKRNSALVATAIAAAMLMTACGGSDEEGGDGGGTAEGGGTFSLQIAEPQNPLVPGNTTEQSGDRVINALWTGLAKFDEDNNLDYSGVAESMESDDNILWTITLKDGWTFHDGTPVNAKSFVDAWNYTAASENAQEGSSFFNKIAGYEDVQAPVDPVTEEITGPAPATELSGLEVLDDLTFTVTLGAPFAQFPTIVTYNPFYPLPEAFFEDPEGFGSQPIGNGPFQADGEFVPGEGITLSRFEDYAGDNKAKAEGVEFRVYAEVETAYTDAQDGNVDIVEVIPPDAISTAEGEFGDRFIRTQSSQITYLGFPTNDERYADPRVRQAISMAIDREAISTAIFEGTRTAADSFIAPVIDGYREGACEFCALDVEQANELLDAAGFDRTEPVVLWFNSDGAHAAWMEAVGNQLRENLDVEFVLNGNLTFAEILPLFDSGEVTGPYRIGWSFDYPSAESYLAPLFTTDASANFSKYDNPEFDSLVAEGDQAGNPAGAVAAYQAAEDLLVQDMPWAPLFFTEIQSVHSENVENVTLDLFQRVDVTAVTVVG